MIRTDVICKTMTQTPGVVLNSEKRKIHRMAVFENFKTPIHPGGEINFPHDLGRAKLGLAQIKWRPVGMLAIKKSLLMRYANDIRMDTWRL